MLQLLDNVAYHAVTAEDTIIPCWKDNNGHYHVDMDLMLVLLGLLNPFQKKRQPLFQMLPSNIKLVTVPLSRYFTTVCCNVPEQLANRGENFSSVVLGGLERLCKSTRDFLCTNGIRNLKMASPFVAHGQAQNDGQGPAGEKINEFWISGSPPPVRSRVYSALLAAILKAAAEEIQNSRPAE